MAVAPVWLAPVDAARRRRCEVERAAVLRAPCTKAVCMDIMVALEWLWDVHEC